MRIVLTVENKSMQFSLTPENDQEKKLLKILEDYSGEAIVRGISDSNMYQYSRFDKLLVTIIQKKNES